jgi:hypothetical protein
MLALLLMLAAERAALPADAIPLDSEEGQKLLLESEAREDFFHLIPHFSDQRSQSTCGAASAAMVMNSLGLAAPEVKEWSPYRRFTQDNVFVDLTPMTLDQLGQRLGAAQAIEAKALHAGSDLTIEALRDLLGRSLADPKDYLIANFLRSALGEEPSSGVEAKTMGHYSPLAAYHRASDRVLILDVARYKYPPLWIPLPKLLAAMQAVDVDSGQPRGLLQVRAAPAARPAEAAPKTPGRLLPIALGVLAVDFLLGGLAGGLLVRRRLRKRAT